MIDVGVGLITFQGTTTIATDEFLLDEQRLTQLTNFWILKVSIAGNPVVVCLGKPIDEALGRCSLG